MVDESMPDVVRFPAGTLDPREVSREGWSGSARVSLWVGTIAGL
jgi:hypothetical protein